MRQLKCVIFGLRNLVFNAGADGKAVVEWKSPTVKEFGQLVEFCKSKGLRLVVFANHTWTFSDGRSAEEVITKRWGEMEWITANGRTFPYKPQAGAMEAVLKHLKCEPNEVLYIGNEADDMRTAVNGGVLFLNATWYHDNIEYGFRFSTPKDIAKFIDVFCLRKTGWSFEIESKGLRFFSLAPFATKYNQYELYSSDARNTKDGGGHAEFWGRYLCSTMFFSGIYKDITYVAPFPRHKANEWNEPLRASLNTFAQCFRKRYIPDLVVRHTSTKKSQYNPNDLTHKDHLNTVKITRLPIKNIKTDERYVNCPLASGKTVLVVDDICTKGRSLEAARLYLERTGVKVILVTWLKTINRPYIQIEKSGITYRFNPHTANNWEKVNVPTTEHAYGKAETDDQAYKELRDKYKSYLGWEWPEDTSSG